MLSIDGLNVAYGGLKALVDVSLTVAAGAPPTGTAAEESLLERLRLSFTHFRLWLWRFSNYGQGRRILADLRGRAVVTIGRELVARGEIARENVTMQSIREWFAANPAGYAGTTKEPCRESC